MRARSSTTRLGLPDIAEATIFEDASEVQKLIIGHRLHITGLRIR